MTHPCVSPHTARQGHARSSSASTSIHLLAARTSSIAVSPSSSTASVRCAWLPAAAWSCPPCFEVLTLFGEGSSSSDDADGSRSRFSRDTAFLLLARAFMPAADFFLPIVACAHTITPRKGSGLRRSPAATKQNALGRAVPEHMCTRRPSCRRTRHTPGHTRAHRAQTAVHLLRMIAGSLADGAAPRSARSGAGGAPHSRRRAAARHTTHLQIRF